MINKNYYLLVSILLVWGVAVRSLAGELPRRMLIDHGWRFAPGDNAGADVMQYDDAAWRIVDLPHDWSIEGRPERNAPSGNDGGYYATGIGWYRKTFHLPASAAGRKLWLYFEGVYERSDVYVNGKRVGGHPYGYTSFFCDISDQARPGGSNVVAVRVDNSRQKNCRWYSGSGIYRHVWLVSSGQMHIANHGVAISTLSAAKVGVDVTLVNETAGARSAVVDVEVPGMGGSQKAVVVPAGTSLTVRQEVSLRSPKLWSPESPALYTACIRLKEGQKVVDRIDQRFGVRTVSYSAEGGFRLNGRQIKLNGCCVHHDNGVLGAASFNRAEQRKAKLVKTAGFNAVRTAHNIPSESFLDACDSLGLLVIDEAFDGWREEKNKNDYSTLFDRWWHDDVTAMVLRDRNHPSVFCWSVGNEVIERKKIAVVTTARKLAEAARACDPERRPVTSALASWDKDWEIYDPLAAEMDIAGYNYMMHKAPGDHLRVPGRVIMQTESYPRDAFKNWAMVEDNTFVIGDFVWTGIDYLGESGIGRWRYEGETKGEHYNTKLYPWHGAYCGDIDITGWRKPISHYRGILNRTGEMLYMAVREPDGYHGRITVSPWAVWPTWESWTWPGHEGKRIEVEVYSRCNAVRLYLDNRMIGEKPTGRAEQFKAVFELPYAAGTLRAEGVVDGRVAATCTLATAGKPAAVRAVPDRTVLAADGQDLSFVAIEVVDAQGRVVPEAAVWLSADVDGPCAIAGAGCADMQDTVSYKANRFKTWKGRAMVVVRSGRKPGQATLRIKPDGLKPVKVRLRARR